MIGLIGNHGAPEGRARIYLDKIEKTFTEKGHLFTVLGLDYRPQQSQMAQSVAASLVGSQSLLFEAGTGVGKSLAYLIPGLMYSIDFERPFVVSTHTISLQEQIIQKDLELCRQLFTAVPELNAYANFKSALLLGKANYCCTTRLESALKDVASDPQAQFQLLQEKQMIPQLAEWSKNSTEGILQEINPSPSMDVWEAINADSSTCSRKNCSSEHCFYQRAKEKIQSAHCIVINHSLLFSLINAGMSPQESDGKGVLFADDFIVLDEAHRVPAIASDHFGIHLSSYALDRALKRIFNPRTNRGMLRRLGSIRDQECVIQAIEAAYDFFADLADVYLSTQSIRRIHQAHAADQQLISRLKAVEERLADLRKSVDDERAQDELKDQRSRILSYRSQLHSFLNLAEDNHVYWLERSEKKAMTITLRSAPLDIAPHLQRALFERNTASILTSATLSNGQQLTHFEERVGAQNAQKKIVSSPFDYKNKVRIYIASDAPQPSRDQGRMDLDYLANMVAWLAHNCQGGSLVLFTSHADLKETYQRARGFFHKIKRPLFAQGIDYSRSELRQRLLAAGNATLLGADSFWTGVDIPGPALSQVIITRLPFENPNHPINEARSEHIKGRGGQPFSEMVIPEALIKFRQGIGRLIRTQSDTGNLVILDSRMLQKHYGSHFIQALPHQNYKRFNLQNRKSIVKKSYLKMP
tara:strand:+ start:423 stop:2516 length:2094 start_codon:yes stop_codon:yes gene_type:complete